MRPTHRLAVIVTAASLCVLASAGQVLACAGLVTPGGNIRLLRTATLAGWYKGYEHYVTSFTFQGGGVEVGSIVPLPAVPSKVERGGDWTLQRLQRETRPQALARNKFADSANAGAPQAERAEVIAQTRIDALDITILKGGGKAVGDWAKEHGFALTPDAPEILDYYAKQSPVFMAARFDGAAANERGQELGEGTPIHLTMPMKNPWVPLRILGLGRGASEFVDADVYLLTPRRPNLRPAPGNGYSVQRDEPASKALLDDLRSDKGMDWIPERMWFSYLLLGDDVRHLRYDLAIDTSLKGAALRSVTDAQNPTQPRRVPPNGTPVPTPAPAKPVPLPNVVLASASSPPAPSGHGTLPAMAAGAGAALGAGCVLIARRRRRSPG